MSNVTEKANRILTIIPLIRAKPGIRIKELARQLGVTPEVVTSDLNTILLCGVPPYLPNDYVSVYMENGGVRIDFADHFKRPISLTPAEAIGLRLALEMLPEGDHGRTEALAAKLRDILPRGVHDGLGQRFAVATETAPLRERIERIEAATLAHREIAIEYYTAGRDAMTERTVRPYALVEHQGHWYLIAYCCLRKRELPFRVDRIKSVAETDRTFAMPEGFDIEVYRRPEMYFPTRRDTQVVVRFPSRHAARQAVNSWAGVSAFSGTPRLEELAHEDDGSLLVSFSVSHTEWVAYWAMQHADRLEIVAPASLRARIHEAADDLLAMYDD